MSTPDPNPARERHWVCAQRLRDRRRALGLTQREVVERLHRNGNRTTNRALSAMENGRGLDLGLLPDLAESLSCSVTYLLGLTSDPTDWNPGCRNENRPPREPLDEVSRQRCAGILGPNVPNGFAAPVRTRRRAVAEVSGAGEAMAEPGA
jgi:transcriptional regulator with XRE-family HTH domain